MNNLVLTFLKKKLESTKGKWVEELPSLLLAIKTNLKGSTNKTPFSLIYKIEVAIPSEVVSPTHWDTIEEFEKKLKKIPKFCASKGALR